MRVHFMLIAAAALTLPVIAVAEPPKADGHQASQPAKTSTEAALASADQVRAPADQTGTNPVKRPRAARVTTCRCGDPDPSDSASNQ